MYKLSFLGVLLVSIPEEYLFALITVLIVGRKDILNFKNKSNIIKLASVAIITALSTQVLRFLGISDVARIIIQYLFFVIAYIVILKLRWFEASVGLLIALLSYLVFEYATSATITSVIGVTVRESYSNDLFNFLFFLPARLLQVGSAVLLNRAKHPLIYFGEIKIFTKSAIKKITIIHVGLFFTLLHIFLNTKYFMIDNPIPVGSNEAYLMWFNEVYSTILATTLIILSAKLSRAVRQKKRQRTLDLLWFKALLVEHENDMAKVHESINKAIQQDEEV